MRINYEVAEIEAFLAVAERLSYAAASEDLNVSRSSLTRRIQKLEYSLDCKLFERTTREVKLTPRGKKLFLQAQELREKMIEIQLAFKGLAPERSPLLTLACVPSIVRRLIPSIQTNVLNVYPRARVRIFDLSSVEAVEAVQQSKCDFGISYHGIYESDLEWQPLESEHFVIAVPMDHKFADRGEVSCRELVGERLIAPWRDSTVRMLLEQSFAQAQLNIRWFHEVRHLTTALLMVEAGYGITPVPRSIFEEHNSGKLAAVRMIEPAIIRQIGLVRRQNQPLRSLAKHLWDRVTTNGLPELLVSAG